MNDIAKEYVLSTVLPTIETTPNNLDIIRKKSIPKYINYGLIQTTRIPLIQTNDPNSDCDHSFYIESGFIYAKNINNDKVFCLKKGIMDYVFSYFNSPLYESFVIDKWRHIIYGITSNSIEMFNSLTLKYISSITNVHPSISKDDPNFEFSIHSIHPIHPLTTSTLTLLIVYSSKYLLYLSNTNISHFRRLDIEDEITNACLSGYSLCLTTRQHVYFIIESPALTLKNEENTYLTSSIELSSESVLAESFGMEFPIEDVKFQCSCYDGDELVSYNLSLPSIRTITSTKRIYDTHDIRTLYNDNLKLFGQFTHSAFIFAAMGEETESKEIIVRLGERSNWEVGFYFFLRNIIQEVWDLTIDGGYNGNATTYLYHLKHFTESKQSIIFEGVHSIVDTLLNLLNMMNIIGKTTTATLSIKVSTVVSSNVDQQIKDFLYKLLINALLTTSNIEDAISLLSKQSPRYLDNDMRSKLSIEKELILCQTSTNGYENDRKRYGEVIFIEMQKILKDIQFIELSMLEFGFHDIYISLLLLKCKSSPIPSYLESLYTTLFEVLVPPDLLVQKVQKPLFTIELAEALTMNCINLINQSPIPEVHDVMFNVFLQTNHIDLLVSSPLAEAKMFIEKYCIANLWKWYYQHGSTKDAVICLIKSSVDDIYGNTSLYNGHSFEHPSEIAVRLQYVTEAVKLSTSCDPTLRQEVTKSYRLIRIMNDLTQQVVTIPELIEIAQRSHSYDILFEILARFTTATNSQIERALRIFFESCWKKGHIAFNEDINYFLSNVGDLVHTNHVERFIASKH